MDQRRFTVHGEEPARLREEFGPLLTELEASDLLNTTARTLQRWRQQKAGPPYVRLGSSSHAAVRYPLAGLRAYLAEHLVAPSKCEDRPGRELPSPALDSTPLENDAAPRSSTQSERQRP